VEVQASIAFFWFGWLSTAILTDIRRNTGQNDLLLASRSDCFAELRVVPSVDFALAGNEWRIWIPGRLTLTFVNMQTIELQSTLHIKNRLRQRSVWSLLSRGGQHHRQVEQLSNAGMRDHGVVVQRWIEVSRQTVQAVLQVQDDEHGVVLVEAQEWHGWNSQRGKRSLSMGLPTICDTDAGEACEGKDGSELHVDLLEAGGYRRGW
jgi:hypothetical protein